MKAEFDMSYYAYPDEETKKVLMENLKFIRKNKVDSLITSAVLMGSCS